MSENIKPITCPLCDSGNMELKEIPKKKPDGRENKGFLWVCEECPGILVEWWDNSDTETFNKYMGYGENHVENHGEPISFFDIYKEYQNLNHELDQLEDAIKSLLPGPELENENWVKIAKEDNSRTIKILFDEYTSLYKKITIATKKYYLKY
jgi:hypothetical protein